MNKTLKNHLFAALGTAIIAALLFYFALPALTVQNRGLLFLLILLAGFYLFLYVIIGYRKINLNMGTPRELMTLIKYIVIGSGILAVLMIIMSIASSPMFNAKRYQSLLQVETGSFTEDVKEITYDQIPTLDHTSAAMLGNRKLGELSDLVSQFEVSDYYTQINYQGRPVRVTPLQYAGVIKWLNNNKNGVPGYIRIDMVTQEVTLVRLPQGMKYSPAEHFGRKLSRLLRFRYPTYIFEEETFEIDEEGTPYWVCPRVKYTIGLYGGRDIVGVVLVNAVTGDSQYYEVGQIPSWVDRVFKAELLIEQFDYYGTLKHGYFNSIFAQKDAQVTTDGYNYIAIDDDVYMYTGITSVASDESNIGFILTNQRTKETRFYAISGAEEYSAMSSAEGVVQHLGYKATFPLLLNVGNRPTYFVALKDNAGLVKMYAMVNVEQYQLVATGQTLLECEKNYIKLMAGGKPSNQTELKTLTGTIEDIRTAVVEGNSLYYFKIGQDQKTYYISVADKLEVVTYNLEDRITIWFYESDQDLIKIEKIEKTS